MARTGGFYCGPSAGTLRLDPCQTTLDFDQLMQDEDVCLLCVDPDWTRIASDQLFDLVLQARGDVYLHERLAFLLNTWVAMIRLERSVSPGLVSKGSHEDGQSRRDLAEATSFRPAPACVRRPRYLPCCSCLRDRRTHRATHRLAAVALETRQRTRSPKSSGRQW